MVWRIADDANLFSQIAWFRDHGFRGVAFHTAPCFTGKWASFDVRRAGAAERKRLAQAVEPFVETSLHGEFTTFDVCLCSPNERIRCASVESLQCTLALAAELGAAVVTVHEGDTRTGASRAVRRDALKRSIAELAESATQHGVTVGFELVDNYDLVLEAAGPVGITLDTGHVSMGNGAGYAAFGSLAGLVRHIGEGIVHVHVHDFDGTHDHIALGSGTIDFAGMVTALAETGYRGMLCMELSPDLTEPEDYVRGKALLEKLFQL
jgi:sugar phosphate isomerase/epimerase